MANVPSQASVPGANAANSSDAADDNATRISELKERIDTLICQIANLRGQIQMDHLCYAHDSHGDFMRILKEEICVPVRDNSTVAASAIDTTGMDEAGIIASYEARIEELRRNLIYRMHKKSFVADLVIYKDLVSSLFA